MQLQTSVNPRWVPKVANVMEGPDATRSAQTLLAGRPTQLGLRDQESFSSDITGVGIADVLLMDDVVKST